MDQLVVHLAMFDGPLDLLLHLVRRAEVNIEDIFVSEITAQYLEIIEQARELDMAVAGDFITMAATLLEIKSRSLLPAPPEDDAPDSEDELDPQAALIRQLTLYNLFREAADPMRELEQVGAGQRYKLPEEIVVPQRELDLTGVTGRTLCEAFTAVLLRVDARDAAAERRRIVPDPYTVQNRMARLRSILRRKKKLRFSELFEEDTTREEIVVTFVAMLEMIRLGRLGVRQKDTFSEITILWHDE